MTNCQHCGAEPMEDQSGPAEDWCSCSDASPVYAVKRPIGLLVRTSSGPVKQFASREAAESYIANRWASGYRVVRYS